MSIVSSAVFGNTTDGYTVSVEKSEDSEAYLDCLKIVARRHDLNIKDVPEGYWVLLKP